jgi:hypothetical protein
VTGRPQTVATAARPDRYGRAAVDGDGRVSRARSSPVGWRAGRAGRLRSFPRRGSGVYRLRRLLSAALAQAPDRDGWLTARRARDELAACGAPAGMPCAPSSCGAPLTGNDPERARRCMWRFCALVRAAYGQPRDPAESARLEVERWRAHRTAQQAGPGVSGELVDALARLYPFVLPDRTAVRGGLSCRGPW